MLLELLEQVLLELLEQVLLVLLVVVDLITTCNHISMFSDGSEQHKGGDSTWLRLNKVLIQQMT